MSKGIDGERSKLSDLVGGLRATPGCLGVETAMTSSGKSVIFAWFRDKQALLQWYHNDIHRSVQNQFFPDRPRHEALLGVPDDIGPIMAIASFTFTDEPQHAQTSLPISQMSIEIYKPVTGGIFLGSRFAPDSLLVPGMLDYTPRGDQPATSAK